MLLDWRHWTMTKLLFPTQRMFRCGTPGAVHQWHHWHWAIPRTRRRISTAWQWTRLVWWWLALSRWRMSHSSCSGTWDKVVDCRGDTGRATVMTSLLLVSGIDQLLPFSHLTVSESKNSNTSLKYKSIIYYLNIFLFKTWQEHRARHRVNWWNGEHIWSEGEWWRWSSDYNEQYSGTTS